MFYSFIKISFYKSKFHYVAGALGGARVQPLQDYPAGNRNGLEFRFTGMAGMALKNSGSGQ